MIQFLQNNEIDRIKWDYCIAESRPKLIYGFSWYLDLVSPGWCGLVEDEYSSVMPLPVKRKYGVSYVIQALYAQQLGVFSGKNLTAEKTTEFFAAIPSKYKFIAVNLNFENKLIPGFASQRINNNFELSLESDYQSIAANFSINTRRNIQKSAGIKVHFDGNIRELVSLKKENTGINRKRIPSKMLENYLLAITKRGAGFICSASIDNKTCAAVFFLVDKKRIYYLIPVSNPLGKEKKAMFAILDSVIQKYAGSKMILDFEGSNIPGLARFFEGFAAVNHPYPTVKINRLPFPLNQFLKS